MSRHLPAVKSAEVLRALQWAGFYIKPRQRFARYLKHPDKPKHRVTPAFHHTDLKRRTLAAIVDQAGLSVDEFIELL